MSLVEAYLKWRFLRYPINMWWRSRYRLLLRERARNGQSVPDEVIYSGLVEDGT